MQALITSLSDSDVRNGVTKGRRRTMLRSAGIEPTSETCAEFDRLVVAERERRGIVFGREPQPVIGDDGFAVDVECVACGEIVGVLLDDGNCDCHIEATERHNGWHCDSCAKAADLDEWMESTLDAVAKLADEHGWDFDRHRYSGGFNTRSRYYELRRECDPCVLGSDDACTCETLTLRLSDHGTAYCSEDISLAMNCGGDDHDIETLAKVLAKPRKVAV